MADESGCASSEPFALRVMGDSMEPEFKDGCIVIIDPGASPEDGSYVIADHDGDYIFRQLKVDGQRRYLKPLNEGYPVLELEQGAQIHGVVVQRAGTRRSYHKHYL